MRHFKKYPNSLQQCFLFVAGRPLPLLQCFLFVAGHPLRFTLGFGACALRFGKVYRVATISVDHEKIDEVVRERVQAAVRKIGAKKRSAPKDEGEGEQDDVDMESLASLESSDSEASSEPKSKCKKSKTGNKAKKVKQQKTQKLTEEQKQIKKENVAEIKKARSVEKLVAPVLPAARRALKFDHAPVALEGLVQAAKEGIKASKKFIAHAEKLSAKGKKCDPWEFDAKKCAKDLKSTTAEAEQLNKIVKNLGTDGLANLAKTAVEAAQAEGAEH